MNLFIHGTGWQSVQRNKRLLTVVSLSFGIGETNCSQGSIGPMGFQEFQCCKDDFGCNRLVSNILSVESNQVITSVGFGFGIITV